MNCNRDLSLQIHKKRNLFNNRNMKNIKSNNQNNSYSNQNNNTNNLNKIIYYYKKKYKN